MRDADYWRVYVYAAILAQPFELQWRIGSTKPLPGKASRFRDYADLPIRFVQHARPNRGLKRWPMRVEKRA